MESNICISQCVYGWRSEDSLQESNLLYYMGSGNPTKYVSRSANIHFIHWAVFPAQDIFIRAVFILLFSTKTCRQIFENQLWFIEMWHYLLEHTTYSKISAKEFINISLKSSSLPKFYCWTGIYDSIINISTQIPTATL